jgi:antitoxin CptB
MIQYSPNCIADYWMARRSLSSGRARADPLAGHDNHVAALYIHPARHVRAFGVEQHMTQRSSEGLDPRRRKLLFRAWRRGVRETDLIVGRFADAYIDKFDDTALDDFERLIEVPNAELYAWVVGAEDAPQEFDTTVLRQLIEFHAQSGGGR